jgi:hypothetical protein
VTFVQVIDVAAFPGFLDHPSRQVQAKGNPGPSLASGLPRAQPAAAPNIENAVVGEDARRLEEVPI